MLYHLNKNFIKIIVIICFLIYILIIYTFIILYIDNFNNKVEYNVKFILKVKFFIVFFTCDVENKNIIGVRKYGTKR